MASSLHFSICILIFALSDSALIAYGNCKMEIAKCKLQNFHYFAFFNLHFDFCNDEGISLYMKNLLNSYTRYFNTKTKRKGPLWQGRFKSVLIKTDEQLLHLTRYIHLNPTSEDLVEKPEDWPYSSYNEYLRNSEEPLCSFSKYLDIEPKTYKEFVESRKDYQKRLSEIKHLLLE